MTRLRTALPIVMATVLTMGASAFAQSDVDARKPRAGMVFGAAAGVGRLSVSGPGADGQPHWAASFPDVQVGHMLSDRVAFVVLLPGTTYHYTSTVTGDRTRTRGFEGIMPSLQMWLTDRVWVKGGVGLALDAPAFYDIRNASERDFHVGPGYSVSVGRDVWQRTNHAVDIRAQLHGGRANLSDGAHRQGAAVSVLVGFTRY
ncbi:MAG: hypothetical protein U0Q11_17850 [Vicinamibacterales bacterium]